MSHALKTHQPCPKCGSSDALAIYEDGHKCFSCGDYSGGNRDASAPASPTEGDPPTPFISGQYAALTYRRIAEDTCRKFGYQVAEHPQLGPVQVANYYDPRSHRVVAQHLRTHPKGFRWVGDASRAGLFGQQCWGAGGRRVIVTEGELDALSLSQALGNAWQVVSVPNGAQGAKRVLIRELEWLESFAEIVLCFDSDEPGMAAAAQCAEIFSPGKCRIATLSLKDASAMWMAGKGKELVRQVFYDAKTFRPDGIVSGADERIKKYVVSFSPKADADYPWPGFNRRVHGMRRGELVTHTAGTGIGKSTICREIAYALGVAQQRKVGIIALEESVNRYGLLLASLAANRRLHIDGDGVTREDRERFFHASIGNGNYYLYDHWGSTAADNLVSRLRYLIKGCGCEWAFLDHLSIAVSGSADVDERKTIDKLMTDLRTLVEETHAGLHLISHLSRRQDGKAHEEGAPISLRDLRGSHAIVQLSDIVFGYERDQQSSDRGDHILVRVLKDRYTGETGKAGVLRYDRLTGRTVEVDEEALDAAPFTVEPGDGDVPF